MKRFPLVIGTTAAGMAAVLLYHPAHPTTPLAAGGTTRTPRSSPPTSRTTPTSAGQQATTPSTVRGRSSTTTRPSSTNAPTSASRTRSATGATEQYGYGTLAARVTVQGSGIVGVRVVGLQTADSYSQQLAGYAIPQLRREVLAAQSSQISGVSGATYTSQAYAASVQSALDKLHP